MRILMLSQVSAEPAPCFPEGFPAGAATSFVKADPGVMTIDGTALHCYGRETAWSPMQPFGGTAGVPVEAPFGAVDVEPPAARTSASSGGVARWLHAHSRFTSQLNRQSVPGIRLARRLLVPGTFRIARLSGGIPV